MVNGELLYLSQHELVLLVEGAWHALNEQPGNGPKRRTEFCTAWSWIFSKDRNTNSQAFRTPFPLDRWRSEVKSNKEKVSRRAREWHCIRNTVYWVAKKTVGTIVAWSIYLTVRCGLILNACREVVRLWKLLIDACSRPSTMKDSMVGWLLWVVVQVGELEDWIRRCFALLSSFWVSVSYIMFQPCRYACV